ncbi:S8 family serine peptidase [Rhodococcus hoagii]|nr:S8 family serine peptidase [Prescottella equi]
MQQRSTCATSATLDRSDFERPAPANVAFEVEGLHQYATGKGVTVAVIDSGVSPNSRLPRLTGGGDYIATTNGLEDCDHHGTLVAGIIAATPSDSDGFVGVAPDASILSIRQTSSAYEPADKGPDAPPAELRHWRPSLEASCAPRTRTST